MSREKEWYGRIQHKYDIEENWKKAVNFIPLEGELIIYGKDINYSYDRFKVGDGVTKVNDLPFTDRYFIKQLPVTYSELTLLRNNSELIPGSFYRITDYQCTTVQENTYATSNKFDIIVQALSNNTLSESCKAEHHYTEGVMDSYFAQCNLTSWEIKYCIDNDTSRFAWADSTSGKGVIYYMKDEHNNECPYDFKNIQFKRNISMSEGSPRLDDASGVETWVYTFCGNAHNIDEDSWSELQDGSVINPYGFITDIEGGTFTQNTVKPFIYRNEDYGEVSTGRLHLNNIVMLGHWETGADEILYYAYCCRSNFFNNNCHDITLGHSSRANTFGESCFDNIIDSGSAFNIFGSCCSQNILSSNCNNNAFGSECTNNMLGSWSAYNNFAIRCCYNTFGDINNLITHVRYVKLAEGVENVKLITEEPNRAGIDNPEYIQNIVISSGVKGITFEAPLELQVHRNSAPLIFEAANTTRVICL